MANENLTPLEQIVLDKYNRMLEVGTKMGLSGVLQGELVASVLKDYPNHDYEHVNLGTIVMALHSLMRKGLISCSDANPHIFNDPYTCDDMFRKELESLTC